MDNKTLKGKNGFALIIVVGAIAVVLMTTVMIVSLSQMDLQSASNYIYGAKAKLLAEGGLDYTVAQLKYSSEGAANAAVDTAAEAWSLGFRPAGNNADLDNINLSNSTQGFINLSIKDCASQINLNSHTSNPIQLTNMLNSLNTVLDGPLSVSDIKKLVKNAPYELESELMTFLGSTKYNAIKDHVTVWGYIDSNVINPADYTLSERSPININTASKEVLVAILNGISADHMCPTCGGDGKIQWGHCPWPYNETYIQEQNCPNCEGSGSLSLDYKEAVNLAYYIRNNRPYNSWADFYASIRASVISGVMGANDADLVMAVLNPNAGFDPAVREYGWANKLGYIYKGVDPIDTARGLKNFTTEGCFDSGGYYEIESAGQVENALGAVVSEKNVYTVVKIYDIYRQTSQSEFETGSYNSSELATGPEPMNLGVSAAVYDGRISLRTKIPSDAGGTFRAGFTTGVNAEKSGGSAAASGNIVINSVVDFSNPGNLLSEGVYMSVGRVSDLRYKALGNLPNQEDNCTTTIGMWIKPVFNGFDSMVYKDYASHEWDGFHWDYRGLPRMLFQVFGGADNPMDAGGAVEYWLLSGSDSSSSYDGGRVAAIGLGEGDDEDLKSIYITTPLELRQWKAGQWHYVELYFCDNVLYPDDKWPPWRELWSYLDGSAHIWTGIERWGFDYMTPYDAANDFCLGCDSQFVNQAAECVIDEFRVWNEKSTGTSSDARWKDGRYSAGSFFYTSSIFNPPGVDDVEWGTFTWTEVIPGLRHPTAILEDIKIRVDAGAGWGSQFSSPSNGCAINSASSTIRYNVEFVESITYMSMAVDTPILEDVTITYMKPTETVYYKAF